MVNRRWACIAGCVVLMFSTVPAMAAGEELGQAGGFSPDLFSLNLMTQAGGSPSDRSVADGKGMRVRVFGIYSQASGSFDFHDEIPLIPSDIDFESTLGMDMDKFTGGALVGLNFGRDQRWHFNLSFNGYYDYTGNKDVGTIVFDGQVFTGVVDSKLEVMEGIAALNYDLIKRDAWTLNTGVDFHLFHADAQLTQVVGFQSQAYELWVPVPALSVGLRWDITSNIYVRGSAAGMYFGDYGDFYDLCAEVGYDFSPGLGVFAGYRYWALNVEYADDTFDFDTGALYAGVELRF